MTKIIAKELAEKISTGSATLIIDKKPTKETLLKMLEHKDSALLIKIAHHFATRDKLMILFDPVSQTVNKLTFGQSDEILSYKEGILYIGANHSQNSEENRLINQGLLLHGLILFIADVVFKNDFSSLKGLEACQAEGIDEPAQFLANTAQSIWTNKGDKCSPKIVAFYREQFIPACEEHFKKLTSQSTHTTTVSNVVTPYSLFGSGNGKQEEPSSKSFDFTA